MRKGITASLAGRRMTVYDLYQACGVTLEIGSTFTIQYTEDSFDNRVGPFASTDIPEGAFSIYHKDGEFYLSTAAGRKLFMTGEVDGSGQLVSVEYPVDGETLPIEVVSDIYLVLEERAATYKRNSLFANPGLYGYAISTDGKSVSIGCADTGFIIGGYLRFLDIGNVAGSPLYTFSTAQLSPPAGASFSVYANQTGSSPNFTITPSLSASSSQFTMFTGATRADGTIYLLSDLNELCRRVYSGGYSEINGYGIVCN